ncbi:MAG: DUF2254 domain-containing protein [Armatimonadaceae bacterium]
MGGVLALVLVRLDQVVDNSSLEGWVWIFAGGPDGARSVLSAIASSILAVTSTTFTITIAVLTLTSSQFGPRLLHNFLRETGNQIVLGIFLGTFLYSLLVLRTVRGPDHTVFVPQIAVTGGVALAILCMVMLIYFIQHTITSIQVNHIISTAGEDLLHGAKSIFPEGIGVSPEEASDAPPQGKVKPAEKTGIGSDLEEWSDGIPVPSPDSGYVQAIDGKRLMQVAGDLEGTIAIRTLPGQMAIHGLPLATVHAEKECHVGMVNRIADAFTLGEYRTHHQDICFTLSQLNEIAVRALSPGINDPNTAISCIDRITAGLCVIARRPAIAPLRYDDAGNLRIVAPTPVFSELLDEGFSQIRRYGSQDAEVMKRLLEALEIIGQCTRSEERLQALSHHADLVLAAIQAYPVAEEARKKVEEQYFMAWRTLQAQREAGRVK